MNLLGLLSAVVVGVSSWIPTDVSQFWVEPDEPAVFQFTASDAAKPDAPSAEDAAKYVVKTTDGAEFATGVGTLDESGLRVEATLPQGYFELEFPATGQAFGVASQPAFSTAFRTPNDGSSTANRTPDGFWGIDGALTWLVGPDAARDDLCRNARRIGIATLRERLNMAAASPSESEFDPNRDRNADVLRQTAIKYGLPILELCHNAPQWTGRVGEKYPFDLLKYAELWGKMGERWAPSWNSIEIWNEPDISFGGDLPGDQYVPVLKACARELSERGVETPVVGGIIAAFRDPWMDCAAECGLLDYCDYFSFHSYCRAPEMASVCLRYQRWLEKFGATGKTTWITECGRPWRKGTDRPNREADLESAIDIVQKGIVVKAIGFDAYFPFVYPYYEENDNNFGMSDRANAPLRSIAAYGRAISLLNGKDCAGEWALGDANVERAFVFVDPETSERVAALYASKREPNRTATFDFEPTFVERITGERLSTAASATAEDGEKRVADFSDGFLFVGIPANVRLELKNDSEIRQANARRLAAKAESAERPVAPRKVASLVARFDFDPKTTSGGNGGYRILDADAKTFAGKLSVFNFDPSAKTVRVRLAATVEEKGGTVDVSARTVRTLPETVDVPARTRVEIPFELNAEAISPLKPLKLRFELADANDSDADSKAPTETLVLSLFRAISQASFDAFANEKIAVSFADLDRWNKNRAPDAKVTFKTPETLSAGLDWGYDVAFGEGDRWVYPQFDLTKADAATKAKLAKSEGVAFRIKAKSDDESASIRLFTFDANGGAHYISSSSLVKADGEERFVVVPFSTLAAYGGTPKAFDPSDVARISVGANTTSENLSIEVGDFVFYKVD